MWGRAEFSKFSGASSGKVAKDLVFPEKVQKVRSALAAQAGTGTKASSCCAHRARSSVGRKEETTARPHNKAPRDRRKSVSAPDASFES